jgi:hypothetical protein
MAWISHLYSQKLKKEGKIMKKLMVTVCLVLALLIMAAPALADPWNVNDPINYSLPDPIASPFGGSGGLFIITNENTFAVLNTFCVELNEYINNTDRVAGISPVAVNGGRFGGSPDPIGSETDWLYAQYATGNLAIVNTKALQVAFWILEEEMTHLEALNFYGATFMTTVDNYLNAAAGHTGSYGTQALNLMNSAGAPAQSHLINVPEPGILILLGIAMGAIGAASWRIRKL